jgi:hypothetical protein
MIIFSPQKLEQRLAKEELSPWEKAKYLVLAVVVSALAGPLFWIAPTIKEQHFGLTNLIQFLTTFIGLCVTYKGIRRCYKSNNKENEFIDRFICLRVPWVIIFGLILAPLCMIIMYAAMKFYPENPDLAPVVISICSPLITLIFYRALNNSFNRIKAMQTGASPIVD